MPTPKEIIQQYLRKQACREIGPDLTFHDLHDEEPERSDLFNFAVSLTREYGKAVLRVNED
jgi:hypothetical protein